MEAASTFSRRIVFLSMSSSCSAWCSTLGSALSGSKKSQSGALMRVMGTTELAGGLHFDSLHVLGILYDVAGGISRWKPYDIRRHPAVLRPSNERQGQDLGVEGRELCTSVARTSKRTYQHYFRCWKLFRVSVGLPVFPLAGVGVNSHVSSLVAYIAYAWSSNGLAAGTIASHLAAVSPPRART